MINNEEFQDEIGNNHISSSAKNPVREDAFKISDDEKIEKIKIFLKENLNYYFEPKQKKDKVVSQVLNKFKKRSKIGIKKYGTTLHENNTDDFLNHLQEELMDAILYLQKLKNNTVVK